MESHEHVSGLAPAGSPGVRTTALRPEAEAGAKIILFGEHAVVYGVGAIAAGVPRALRLRAQELPDPSAPSRLSIPAWGVETVLGPRDGDRVGQAASAVISACSGPLQGWTIRGETSLPCRAGLGSSAALSIALARLCARSEHMDEAALVEASLRGEEVFHGAPSGLDSWVCAQGGLVGYQRGGRPQPLALAKSLDFVVVSTGVPRDTAKMIEQAKSRLDLDSELRESLLAAFAAVDHAARRCLEQGRRRHLGELMGIAHGLLSSLGVSHPALDRAIGHCLDAGALGAKLTGAGGGGSAIALFPSGLAAQAVNELRTKGLDAFSFTLEASE